MSLHHELGLEIERREKHPSNTAQAINVLTTERNILSRDLKLANQRIKALEKAAQEVSVQWDAYCETGFDNGLERAIEAQAEALQEPTE